MCREGERARQHARPRTPTVPSGMWIKTTAFLQDRLPGQCHDTWPKRRCIPVPWRAKRPWGRPGLLNQGQPEDCVDRDHHSPPWFRVREARCGSAKPATSVRVRPEPRPVDVAKWYGTSLPWKTSWVRFPSSTPRARNRTVVPVSRPSGTKRATFRDRLLRTVGLVVGLRPSKPATQVRFLYGAPSSSVLDPLRMLQLDHELWRGRAVLVCAGTGSVPTKRRWRRAGSVNRRTGFDSPRGLCGVGKWRLSISRSSAKSREPHKLDFVGSSPAPATICRRSLWSSTFSVRRRFRVRFSSSAPASPV
jgi:hypothetical protein